MLDDLAVLAIRALDVPVAIFSCDDDPARPVVACAGIDVTDAAPVARLADGVPCAAGLLEVGDATEDPRLAGHPLVCGGIRFFAAVALVAPGGERLGALWVLDRRARRLDATQRDTLHRLARLAAHALAAACSQARRPLADGGRVDGGMA